MGNAGKTARTERAVRLRVAVVASVAVGAALCSLQSIACSGNTSSSSLTGEWQLEGDGGESEEIFFNGDGTCGVVDTLGAESYCRSDCTYEYNGDTLTLTFGSDGGVDNAVTVTVTVSGGTFTVTPTDGGGDTQQYTRVNANASNSCP